MKLERGRVVHQCLDGHAKDVSLYSKSSEKLLKTLRKMAMYYSLQQVDVSTMGEV